MFDPAIQTAQAQACAAVRGTCTGLLPPRLPASQGRRPGSGNRCLEALQTLTLRPAGRCPAWAQPRFRNLQSRPLHCSPAWCRCDMQAQKGTVGRNPKPPCFRGMMMMIQQGWHEGSTPTTTRAHAVGSQQGAGSAHGARCTFTGLRVCGSSGCAHPPVGAQQIAHVDREHTARQGGAAGEGAVGAGGALQARLAVHKEQVTRRLGVNPGRGAREAAQQGPALREAGSIRSLICAFLHVVKGAARGAAAAQPAGPCPWSRRTTGPRCTHHSRLGAGQAHPPGAAHGAGPAHRMFSTKMLSGRRTSCQQAPWSTLNCTMLVGPSALCGAMTMMPPLFPNS